MDNTVIIKSGALFSISSRVGGNNDLTLDESVYIKLYKNAIINIGNNLYRYGPITPNPNNNHVPPIPFVDNVIVLDKGSKYHINNINIDPIGLTKSLEISQKVCFNPNAPIIVPSETILHTLDDTLEFRLTKATHCTLS